jgi:hypothetical protein
MTMVAMNEAVAAEGWSNDRLAARYGVTPRTVKRWKAVGRAAEDVCPVEDPLALIEWWQRRMKWRVPASVLEEAERVARGVGAKVEAAGGPRLFEDPGPGAGRSEGVDLETMVEADDLGVGVMRKVVSARAMKVAEAWRSGDETEIAAAERKHQQALSSLRQLERTREELARKTGAVVAREEVAAWVKRRETKLAQAFATSLARVAERARTEITELRQLVEEEKDRCFRALKDERGVAG